MELNTSQFGCITITPEIIITMPAGLPGFPHNHRFVVLGFENTRPFFWYQSLENPDLAFSIINPYLFRPDYAVDMKAVRREMDWPQADEPALEVYVMVNAAQENAANITANLMAPLIINTRCQQALQYIMPTSPYPHDHPIFQDNRT